MSNQTRVIWLMWNHMISFYYTSTDLDQLSSLFSSRFEKSAIWVYFHCASLSPLTPLIGHTWIFWNAEPCFNICVRLKPTLILFGLSWRLYCNAQLILHSFRCWRTCDSIISRCFFINRTWKNHAEGACTDTSRDGSCGAQWRTRQRSDRGVRRSNAVLEMPLG